MSAMIIPDIRPEIVLKTSRSGGAGGQNVNKVETAVSASFHIETSAVFTDSQKALLLQKLASRLDKEGKIAVRAQRHRTQLANKEEAVNKLVNIISEAFREKKPRIASRPSKLQKEKRLDNKKRLSEKKSGRRSASWE